jgi:hypothetical protein
VIGTLIAVDLLIQAVVTVRILPIARSATDASPRAIRYSSVSAKPSGSSSLGARIHTNCAETPGDQMGRDPGRCV